MLNLITIVPGQWTIGPIPNRRDTEKLAKHRKDRRADDKARAIDVGRWRGSEGDWTIFSFIEMVMAGTWEDFVCVCVVVCRCVFTMSWTRTPIWNSGLYTGRVFLITQAGIITSVLGGINSHLCVITNHGNSCTLAFLPGLDERQKEMRWNAFSLQHGLAAWFTLFLWLFYPHCLSPANPDICLPLLSSSYTVT